MCKKYYYAFTVVALFAFILTPAIEAAPSPAGSVARIKNLELISVDGGVRVRVHTASKIPFAHQIESPKNGKPHRIILDCQDADHFLGANKFSSLPSSVISRIRTSQFSVKPQHITRIVLDLKKEAFYRVEQTNTHIDLFITDRSARRFSTWSSAQFVAEMKKSEVQSSAAPVSKPAVEVAKAEATSNKETTPKIVEKNSVSSSLSNAPLKPAVTVAKASNKQSKVAPKVAQNPGAQQKPVTVAKAPAKQTKATPKVAVKKTAEKSMAKPTVQPKTVTVAKAPAAQVKAPVLKKTANKAAPAKQPKATSTVAKAPATLAKAAPKNPNVQSVKPANKVEKAQKPAIAKKQVVASPVAKPAAKSAAVAKVDQTKAKSADVRVDKSSATSGASLFASTANASPNVDTAPANEEDKGYSATFRRSAVAKRKAKLKGTQVAQFPKRLTIKYKSQGTRDPFQSLFKDENKDDNGMTMGLPNVEALAMVGTLKDVKGKTRGLFEDIDGRGYILAKGDKVRNGTVLKVTEHKAYFQIFEYGWSRTVALSLDG